MQNLLNRRDESSKGTCDVHEVARYLNMTPRRVQMLVKSGILPRPGMRGEYELIPCIHAYIEHLKDVLYRYTGIYSKLSQQGIFRTDEQAEAQALVPSLFDRREEKIDDPA